VLGPAVGGWLGAKNPRLPFWVAAAFSLLNALYGLLVLPESLSPAKRQPRIRWKDANPLGALKLLRSHPELLGLATVNFLGYVAHEVYATVFVLYATYRYAWSQRMIGAALAIVGVSSMVISASIVGPGIFAVTFATFIADERPVKVPGAPWYLAAALLVLAAVVARVVLPKRASVKGAESGVAEAPTT
jgi:DHA1 family tetracycline resistance protein-like MFS transporter